MIFKVIFAKRKKHVRIYWTFIRETGTEKTVLITMITSFGLAPGGYSDDIQYHSVGYVGASESKSRLPTKHKVLYSVVKALCMSAFLFAGHSR